VDQDRLAPERSAFEELRADGPAPTGVPADDHGIQIGQCFQRERREVLAVGEAVEGGVEVSGR
jgi:hypothetical protein